MTEGDGTMADVDTPEIRSDGGESVDAEPADDEPAPEMRDVDHAGADSGVSVAFERGPETEDEGA